MVRVQGLKPKPNHLRLNFKVWFSNLAKLNSKFSLGFGKSALNQTKLNFGSTSSPYSGSSFPPGSLGSGSFSRSFSPLESSGSSSDPESRGGEVRPEGVGRA